MLRAVREVQRAVLHQLPGLRAWHRPHALLPDRELHLLLLLGRNQTQTGEMGLELLNSDDYDDDNDDDDDDDDF